MAAAIGGTKRGKLRAQQEILEKNRIERSIRDKLYEEEKEKVANIMEIYDSNKSGYLEKSELPQLLEHYNLDQLGRKGNPTEDDVTCLVYLCDWDGDGKISKVELKNALLTWLAYMQHSERIYETLKRFDLSDTGKINRGELKPLLVELNKGQDVPDAVTEWVWDQASVLEDDSLNTFELARAVAVWYAWAPETEPADQQQSLAKLRNNMNPDNMPERATPPPKSSFCVLL
eukprot:gnl/MRDRNA2_/MRDRNA2_101615_c0_seq1.p1 gnl/MRDRNA2_/MRDRNA2_101615_c0~~gnl/MRDRNA2_/MRDRNA2_101615_c0_seq1.p1  ORF type:complete len:231 (-),score=57.54 gnl/MRDRNA2_/MRDRNA2_101615_c0_seq1:337-1029(-)